MRIALVMPKSERVPILRTEYSPPLGLMSIGAMLRQRGQCNPVELINGEFMDEDQVVDQVRQGGFDIVGISTNVGNYRSALAVAKRVKSECRGLLAGC